MEKEQKIKSSSVISLILFTMGSRILGLVREIVKAKFLGAGYLNDAFNMAFTIPNMFRRFFAESSMTAAFIPTFKGFLKKDNNSETKQFLNSIFTTLSFLVTLTVVIGTIATPLIVKVLNEDKADIPEIIFLTRIMFPYLAFVSIAALFQGVLNCLNVFGPAGFVPILFNILIISSTLFLSKFTGNHARAMAVGVLLGGFTQMAFQLPYILKRGFSFKFTTLKKAFTNPGTKKVGRILAPTLLGMGAFQLSIAAANVIALRTGVGISSSLDFSLRLQELVLGVFAVSIGTVLISSLSKDAKDKNWYNFSNSLELALNVIALITIPITLFAFIHSREIVELVYARGEFRADAVIRTAGVFRAHILGLLFIAVTRIVGPAFYSLEDSKTPALLSTVSILSGVVFMFILAPRFKAIGIASGTTISGIIQMVLYFIFLRKKENINFGEILKPVVVKFLKLALFSAVSAVPLIFLKNPLFSIFVFNSSALRLGIPLVLTTLLYFSVYGLLLLIFKDSTLKRLLNIAKKR